MARRVEDLLAKYGLPPDADVQAIEARREGERRTYHPDSTPDASPEVRRHLQEHLGEIESDFKAILAERKARTSARPARSGSADQGPGVVDRLGGLDVKTVRIGVAGLIAAAIVIFLGVSLLGGGGDDAGIDQKALDAGKPVAVSESQLTGEASSLEHAAYWVGPRDSTSRYELTSTPDGKIFVRYLTGEAAAGDPSSGFLTVGTYAIPDAARALGKAAQKNGQTATRQGDDLVLTGGDAGNAYIVFADQPGLQIEVYSPVPGEADRLVTSGAVTRLG